MKYTLPETNSSPLKMDGWNTILSYWDFALFSGANLLLVLGRVSRIASDPAHGWLGWHGGAPFLIRQDCHHNFGVSTLALIQKKPKRVHLHTGFLVPQKWGSEILFHLELPPHPGIPIKLHLWLLLGGG